MRTKRKIVKRNLTIRKIVKEESFSGFILIFVVIVALIWANSRFYDNYLFVWHDLELGISMGNWELKGSLTHWINDGLMALFFFTIGLEIKREVIAGELSSMKKATMPITAAIGGMIIPAIFYVIININNPDYLNGWGVPMATDIAFALGMLSLLGDKVNINLKIFLMALAIADDLGAILIIAIFYTESINYAELINAAIFLSVLIIANQLGVRRTLFYAIVGLAGVWMSFIYSGVHATIAGVLIAFTIPVRSKVSEKKYIKQVYNFVKKLEKEKLNESSLLTNKQAHLLSEIENLSEKAQTPLQHLEHALHPITAFFILPLFALANAGVHIEGNLFSMLFHPISIGIIIGLVLGKFIGISLFSRLVVWLKWASLPEGVSWRQIYGVGLLAGIGFTMSIFISGLAFESAEFDQIAKVGIFAASILAATLGLILLKTESKKPDN